MGSYSNKFFVSYNRMRDYRDPFSENFPTIEIGQDGITYTTIGHEPFSIHNILDSDIWQFTDNLSYFTGNHVITLGASYELFKFYNSFNLFRNGLFGLPFAATTFFSTDQFFAETDPDSAIDFLGMNGSGAFKGENIDIGQFSIYAQDEYQVSSDFNLSYGLRVDMPIYITKPVDNPYSRSLTALDENGNPEQIDQSKLPDSTPLFSPRVGFNWDATGNRDTQVRGGTGIFTGRLPFVWVGNVISNPGANPNLPGYMQSFDLNAMDPEFKWPQMWTSNLAVDHRLPWDMLGTVEFVYSQDINAIFVRNADLVLPESNLPDGRPYYGGSGNNELNPDGAGIYVIDNKKDGYNYHLTLQLRKFFNFGLTAYLSYTYLEAKNIMKSTEIASVLWQENPISGSPNNPVLGYSEFGNRNRFVLAGNYRFNWDETFATSFGLVCEIAEGNRFAGQGGNRYSFVYAGDVNGDGYAGNDLIYIPNNQSEITFAPYTDAGGNTVSADQQWNAFNAFIEQDDYLSENRGKIADRFGALNPWYVNLDFKILQDFAFDVSGQKHTFQLSLDFLNVLNMINSDWGVRQVANSAATSPLELVPGTGNAPEFHYKSVASETYAYDLSQFSRWRVQVGLRYLFN